jgi:hypothetical protein
MYMRMSQENQCIAFANKNVFFFTKNGDQKGRTGPFWGFGASGRERMWKEDVGG